MIIYGFVSPSGKIYIGKTSKDLGTRISKHKYDFNHNRYNTRFYMALKKYGFQKFAIILLDKCSTVQELDNLEKFYIKKYNSNNIDYGYNMTEGGDGVIFTDEIRRKISIANKGKCYRENYKHSPLTKLKISLGNKGKSGNNFWLGKKRTEETKKRMSEFQKGRPALNKRQIICGTDNKKFPSITEASLYYGVLITAISNNLSKKTKLVNQKWNFEYA